MNRFIFRITHWLKNVQFSDLEWDPELESQLRDMYLEAKTSTKYSNLVDEDREYLLKKLKRLNSILDMSEVSKAN